MAGGLPSLEAATKALLPTGFLVWYIAGMSFVAALFVLLFKAYPPSKAPGFFWRLVLEVFTELRAVYRIGAGVLLAFCLIWAFSQTADDKLTQLFWIFLVYGVAAVIASTAYSLFANWAQPTGAP